MTVIEVIILLVAGVAVGFINTIAGGATVISLAALMFMGIPLPVANGTHRIAAAFQTLTSVIAFRRKGVLDLRKGIRFGIPAVAGSITGSLLAIGTDERSFSYVVGVVMLVMMFVLLFKPDVWLHARAELTTRPVSARQHLIFFALGFYGGFIYVGIGYLLMAALVLSAGYNLVKANAIKVLIVLMYVPFSLGIYMYGDLVNYAAGFTLAAGQVAGAWMGARVAVSKGSGFIRWFMIGVILISVAQIFGLVNLMDMIHRGE